MAEIKSKRKAISKKLRFEVFKRDNFTCQYCGRKAPDVVLEVDHLNPVSKGGKNELINLTTSCFECNRGKSDRTLDDNSIVNIQRNQLEEANEKIEQMKLMVKWKEELDSGKDLLVESISNLLNKKCSCSLNAFGKKGISKAIRDFGYDAVYDATNIAIEQYSEVEEAVKKIPGICYNTKMKKENPQEFCYKEIKRVLRTRKIYEKDIDDDAQLLTNYEYDEKDFKKMLSIIYRSHTWEEISSEFIDYLFLEWEDSENEKN